MCSYKQISCIVPVPSVSINIDYQNMLHGAFVVLCHEVALLIV